MNADETFEAVPVDLWINEGRVSMSADGEARVGIRTPESQPAAILEPEYTLQVSGNDFDATISLDAEQADGLRDVLEGGESE